MFYHAVLKNVHETEDENSFDFLTFPFVWICIYVYSAWEVKCGASTQYVPVDRPLSVHHMCRNNVMSMTYVLERDWNTDCCPVLSMGAHGALLWQSALNMSLGMLHYLHCAFLWHRWDMTGATGSSWIKQGDLKAQGEGRGWWGGLGRQQNTGTADCNAHAAVAWGAGGEVRQGGWKGQTGTRGGRDDRAERKDFLEEKVERRRNRGRGEGESGKQRAGITTTKKISQWWEERKSWKSTTAVLI